MTEQEQPRRINWDKLMAWRIVDAGIEVDTRRPLMMYHHDEFSEYGMDDFATVNVPIRLRDGRAIATGDLPTDWVQHRVGPFGAIFCLNGQRLSPIVEGHCMPDFACDCGSGEIVNQWCSHKEEVSRRSTEIINEVGRTHAGEISKLIRSWKRFHPRSETPTRNRRKVTTKSASPSQDLLFIALPTFQN